MLETFDEQHFIDVNKGGWLSARGGGGTYGRIFTIFMKPTAFFAD